jgi:diaminohydroxyphosphoribosylaminopyrimidine deaminase/5-amino-6-(5-phosphoribosylamino)uracil reductase
MPSDARMLKLPGRTLIVFAGDAPGADLEAAGAELLNCPGTNGRVDLTAMLRALGERQCNDLLVEAGPRLSGAMLSAGLADELVIYMAPHLMGDTARGMFALAGLEKLADRVQLRIRDTRMVGGDLRIRAQVREDETD